MSAFDDQYVVLNVTKYRRLLEEQRRKMDNLRRSQGDAGMEDVAYISLGRASGLHLATSFLAECTSKLEDQDGRG